MSSQRGSSPPRTTPLLPPPPSLSYPPLLPLPRGSVVNNEPEGEHHPQFTFPRTFGSELQQESLEDISNDDNHQGRGMKRHRHEPLPSIHSFLPPHNIDTSSYHLRPSEYVDGHHPYDRHSLSLKQYAPRFHDDYSAPNEAEEKSRPRAAERRSSLPMITHPYDRYRHSSLHPAWNDDNSQASHHSSPVWTSPPSSPTHEQSKRLDTHAHTQATPSPGQLLQHFTLASQNMPYYGQMGSAPLTFPQSSSSSSLQSHSQSSSLSSPSASISSFQPVPKAPRISMRSSSQPSPSATPSTLAIVPAYPSPVSGSPHHLQPTLPPSYFDGVKPYNLMNIGGSGSNTCSLVTGDCLMCQRGPPPCLEPTSRTKSPHSSPRPNGWTYILRVALYTMRYNIQERTWSSEFCTLKTELYPFLLAHWDALGVCRDQNSVQWKKQVQDTLSHSRDVFESGLGQFHQYGLWRLKPEYAEDPWLEQKPERRKMHPTYDKLLK